MRFTAYYSHRTFTPPLKLRPNSEIAHIRAARIRTATAKVPFQIVALVNLSMKGEQADFLEQMVSIVVLEVEDADPRRAASGDHGPTRDQTVAARWNEMLQAVARHYSHLKVAELPQTA